MERREFLRTGLAALAGTCLADRLTAHPSTPAATGRFKLKYAPHFGMFKHSAGDDLLDQLRFAADQGFTAWQDNGLKTRPVEVQEKIGRTLASLGLEMGVFVASAVFQEVRFSRKDEPAWQRVLQDIRDSVEVAKRVNAKCVTVVPGRFDDGLGSDCQTANCVELLKRCCGILEPHGLVMVMEPLNWGGSDSGTFPSNEPPRGMDLPSREQPVLPDPVRRLPPTDHRRRPDPEHGLGLAADRLFPVRRQSGAEGTRHGRNRLPQRVQPLVREGLFGDRRHGARQFETRCGGRAGGH